MRYEIPKQCPCGACLPPGLSNADLAARLAAEWLALERANAAMVGEPLVEWAFEQADVVEILGSVMRMGHFRAMGDEDLAALAGAVGELAAADIARRSGVARRGAAS